MQKSLTATQLAKSHTAFAQTKHQVSDDARSQLRSEGIKEHANYHGTVSRSMTSRHAADRRLCFALMVSVTIFAVAVMYVAFF